MELVVQLTVRYLFATYSILLTVVLATGHITRYASNSFSIPHPHHLSKTIFLAGIVWSSKLPSMYNLDAGGKRGVHGIHHWI